MLDLSATPLVSPAWLAARLGQPDLRVVDARWRGDGSSRALFHQGHLPGAVPLDWHLDLNETRDGVRDRLLDAEAFARVMSQAGIGDETRVVAYADQDYSGAARVWWALRYYGHDQAAVLNGGLDAWLAQGLPLASGAPAPRPPAVFTPRPQPRLLATAAEIQRAIDERDPAIAFVDTRPPEQYRGQAVWTPAGSRYLASGETAIDIGARSFMRAGHIPGAVSLTSSDNLDPAAWTYLPPEALRARAQAAGLRPDQRVITYCGVGISASLGLLALHLAGFPDLALYDGSWEEWGTDPARPVERA
jgi:thiosulfate/3-mercaptopyruvate sulfurtransferase